MGNKTTSNKQKKENASNILTFKKPPASVLTDNEINSLFLGLINLIKRNVVYQKEHQYKQELAQCKQKMQQYLATIEQKNLEIENLKKQLNQN